MNIITRKYVRNNPQYLFLFGDNLIKNGYGGQAGAMRGEPNCIGIPTKRKPDMNPSSFFSDDIYEEIISIYEHLFERIKEEYVKGKYEAIVIPSEGLGTGLARLNKYAPKIYEYLQNKLKELEKGG